MRPPLAIAVAQPPCRSYDVAANAGAHAAAIREAGARVVVFPEMSLTGYHLDAPEVSPDDPRLAPIVAACAATGSVALVGAPVPGPHIGVLAVDGEGVMPVYHKVWLGGREPERFRPGAAPSVIEVDGWRLGLAVCKDTGVARHAADTAALGMDVYVAGVVHRAEEAGLHGERARRVAAGHGVWTATASFAGPTGEGYDRTAGGSGIWAPDGACLAEAGPGAGDLARAELHPARPSSG
ncbi:carbon-nitrogen hydrolase family protein [Thermoactinospora rubra]|uniref:carbon-nitrogen hydrolase family protein n=1 Tax=Thermoactinospora rubra TaxID=1088767 RepID=UPI000A111DD8|nr:carbon-nitrogen hydrolase family protein [Thermoactinospora rubra]